MSILNIKTAYLIGIKGVGMTALSQILQGRGVKVSGSDTHEKFFTNDVLANLNIQFVEGFSRDNVPADVDVVISSVAYINSNNPEVKESQKRGFPIITYPEALAELFNDTYGIAVTGSHGKSTTAAMLGVILEYAGFDPTVVVGARVNQWKSNARVGKSKYFIIEADEYRDAFLQYYPKIIVLTNIDYDHPDYFPTRESYAMSFKKFIDRVPKNNLISLPSNPRGYLVNTEDKKFDLRVPGEYNQQNANLAYMAALKLGVKAKIAHEALKKFNGIARRFESYGKYKGAFLFDDYAHHPTEIKAVLAGAKEKYPNKKIIVLFQPHTFSRTKKLFKDFTAAFNDANETYILKTYSSVREKGEDIWGKKLASALNAKYFITHESAANHIKKELNGDTIFLVIGAGDGWQVLKNFKINRIK